MMNRIRTILMDMPVTVKGMVVKHFDDGEDYYTIVLNARYNEAQRTAAYWHEIEHIRQKDLEGYCDTDQVEKERHA